MKTTAELKSYEELEFAITIAAPVTDWRAMLKVIKKMNEDAGRYSYSWPLSGFVGCIEKMLSDLDKTHADVLIKEDQFGAAHKTA